VIVGIIVLDELHGRKSSRVLFGIAGQVDHNLRWGRGLGLTFITTKHSGDLTSFDARDTALFDILKASGLEVLVGKLARAGFAFTIDIATQLGELIEKRLERDVGAIEDGTYRI
jgi:hypothetical protein